MTLLISPYPLVLVQLVERGWVISKIWTGIAPDTGLLSVHCYSRIFRIRFHLFHVIYCWLNSHRIRVHNSHKMREQDPWSSFINVTNPLVIILDIFWWYKLVVHACSNKCQFATYTSLRGNLIEINTDCVSLDSSEATQSWVPVSKHRRLLLSGIKMQCSFSTLQFLCASNF